MSGRAAGLTILVFFLSLTVAITPVLGVQVYRYEYNPLIIDSALIVVANIVKVSGNYSSTELGLSGLVYQISVSDWVKGGGYPYPLQIVDGNSTVEGPTGDPSIRTGSEYVLFLFNTGVSEQGVNPGGLCLTYPSVVRCGNFPPPTNETWGITGGPQGKFLVKDGLVYGYKTLYPQLYTGMIVDANAVPLRDFVSMIQWRWQFLSGPSSWALIVILVVLLGWLPSRFRRFREWRHYARLKRMGTPILYAASLALAAYLLENSSFSFLTTPDFWTGFLVFGGGLLAVTSMVLKENEQRRVGVKKFPFGKILLAVSMVSGAIVVAFILFQAGDTQFEKDYYRLALIDGIFIGVLVGAMFGDALYRLNVLDRVLGKVLLSKSSA